MTTDEATRLIEEATRRAVDGDRMAMLCVYLSAQLGASKDRIRQLEQSNFLLTAHLQRALRIKGGEG